MCRMRFSDGLGEGEAGGMAADKKINHLTGKVAQYYGLEESDIQIQWKND